MNYLFTNWKTSVPAVILGIVNLVKPIIGIQVPDEVVNAITYLCIFAIGIFAKDGNVTGGSIKNTQ